MYYDCDPDTACFESESDLQYVGGRALTLWALLAGAVERLKVDPLALFAPGAR